MKEWKDVESKEHLYFRQQTRAAWVVMFCNWNQTKLRTMAEGGVALIEVACNRADGQTVVQPENLRTLVEEVILFFIEYQDHGCSS